VWDTSNCESTATFDDGLEYDGEEIANDDWRIWPYSMSTPWDWGSDANDVFAPRFHNITSVRATCELKKTTYLGRRSYRAPVFRSKTGASTYRRSGCSIYSYSTGRLTIDCRRSSSSGSASWRFPLRRSDWYREGSIYFDRSESTLGPHKLSSVVKPRSLVLTETVFPGTMITVTEVDATISRRYWRSVYRKQKKTLTVSWYG
jgi:hypothetical protein